MEKVDFGHLHVHSTYSVLDGMSKVDELVSRAEELGQKFIALTDHGSTSGLYHFQKECDKRGIKPILGTEFYINSPTSERKSGHVIALAMNDKGLENIFILQAYAYSFGFHYKPRVSFDMLKKHSEGLVITSACLAHPINQYIMQDNVWDAMSEIKAYKEAFGDNFYLEIQSNVIDEQIKVNKALVSYAKEFSIPLVLTNDVHYVYKDDWYPHEVLLALQTRKKMDDPERWKFPSTDFWLKSADEMVEPLSYLDEQDIFDAMNNTSVIADKCSARIYKGNFLPKFHATPKGLTARQHLVDLTKVGIKAKSYEAYVSDIQKEIDIIDGEGLPDYFLIVQDYIAHARKNDILVGDGRGSGAGSKTSYALDIHRVDPAKYNLLFERFMAPGRQPDIDVDFSDQEFIFRYLQEKHGKENVAHIITFGTMTPKAVSRKVFSAFNHTMAEIKRINSHIGENDDSIASALARSAELRKYAKQYEVEFAVIARLEGVISHEGTHAGGIIIQENLSSKLPLKTSSDDGRHDFVVCFDKYMLEELGHWKFDVLGLETLPILKRCLDSIYANHGVNINLYEIDYNDQEVYAQLSEGDVSGVFQLAAQGGKLIEQQPRNFDDLIAINSLIRPGVGDWNEYIARRRGKAWSTHPDRLYYMKDTEGTMTYQEQFILDGVTFAGWGVAFADKHLRKNKDIRNDVKLKELFISDGVKRGYAESDLAEIWSEIENAVDGGYSFNKSHSASYAMMSYQTAWLKCHYPIEFYCALMTSKGDNQDEISTLISECKRKGIPILPPSINSSTDDFIPTPDGIRYRITTISHVGAGAISDILRIRPVADFSDFLSRRTKKLLRNNVIISLIKAGAFDEINPKRHELLHEFDMYNRKATQVKLDYQCETYSDDLKTKLEWEKQSLGMYLSAHPMDKYSFKSLEEYDNESFALVGGEVGTISTALQKNGEEMAFITISTKHGIVRCLVFANNWRDAGIKMLFTEGNNILIRGKRSGDSILFNSGEELM